MDGKESVIMLKVRTVSVDGRDVFVCEYDPAQLGDLCLALLTDIPMRETALLAAAYAVAREQDPEVLLGKIRSFAGEIRSQSSAGSDKNLNDKQT